MITNSTTDTAAPTQQSARYKWTILVLAAMTFAFVMGVPNMSLSVLFEEIAADLQLSLVQVGWIWGMTSVMGIAMGLIGGSIGDRIGPRRTLIGACLLVGITGAARGFAWDFASLAVTMFLLGFAQWAIPMNIHKTCSIWFGGARLGMANGVVSVGMAFGFMLGSLLAATVLSPLLGGWRNVFILYGVIAVVFSLLWLLAQEKTGTGSGRSSDMTLGASLRHLITIPNVWLLSIALMGVASCVQGMLGYLPLYLVNSGWSEASAGRALGTFHAVSMVAAIPITMLSDRIGSRRDILLVAALFSAVGTGLLAIVDGAFIWGAVVIAGIVRDGFMAVAMTAMMEVPGVGTKYAGTATGFSLAWLGLGSVIAPPLGNSLARFGAGMPFMLWAGLAVGGFVVYWAMPRQPSRALN